MKSFSDVPINNHSHHPGYLEDEIKQRRRRRRMIAGGLGILVVAAIVIPVAVVFSSGTEDNGCDADLLALTNYWVAFEGQPTLLDACDLWNGPPTIVNLGENVKSSILKDCDTNQPLANVDYNTFMACYCEGTCDLQSDNKTYNVQKTKAETCFSAVPCKWGVGQEDNCLTPWSTITGSSEDFNKTFYIKQLDGYVLPNGQVHNGCVRVEDECRTCQPRTIDLLVGTFAAYQTVTQAAIPTCITATENATCPILTYTYQ